MQSLISKVPDESTLIHRILTDQFPVLFEATAGVTHGMTVLTLDERTVCLGIFQIPFTILRRDIHRTEDIGIRTSARTLILHWTAQVLRLDPVIGNCEVRTVNSLITHRPSDNAGMVIIDFHVMLVTLQNHLFKQRCL